MNFPYQATYAANLSYTISSTTMLQGNLVNQGKWKSMVEKRNLKKYKITQVPDDSFLVPVPETAFWLAGSATAFELLTALAATDFRENILDVAFVKVFRKLLCLWHGEVSSFVNRGGDLDRLRCLIWMAGRGLSLKN